MVKIIWMNKKIQFESAAGSTVQQTVVSNKEHFNGISLNHSPMKVLKRNPINNMPASCIQIEWDYVLRDDDEIEFFSPGGVFDLERESIL
jgi:hypothetical protein